MKGLVKAASIEGVYLGKIDEVNPRAECRRLKEIGFNTVVVLLYETYRAKIFFRSSQFKDLEFDSRRDLVDEYAEACKREELHLWFWGIERGAPVGSELMKRYADCLERDVRGGVLPLWGDQQVAAMCINSRWKDLVKSIYGEALRRYPEAEGIVVVDAPGQYQDAGFCENCRNKFEHRFHVELPGRVDWKDTNSLWWKHVWEKTRWWTDYIDDLSRFVKGVRPGITTGITANPGNPNAGINFGLDWWRLASLKSLDLIIPDCFYPPNHNAVWIRFCSNWTSAMMQAHSKKCLTMFGVQDRSVEDIVPSCASTVVRGSSGVIIDGFHLLLAHPSNIRPVKKALASLERAHERSSARSGEDPVAVLFSKRAWAHFGALRGQNADLSPEYMLSVEGVYEALELRGIHSGIVFESDIATLTPSKYKVLVVSRGLSLNEEELRQVEQYVHRGGGLYVSDALTRNPSSSRSERRTAGWEKLLHAGVRPRRILDPLLLKPSRHEITRIFEANARMQLRYWLEIKRERLETTVLDGGSEIASYVRPDDARAGPAAIAGSYGKGRVVYFAEPVELLVKTWADRSRKNRATDHSMWFQEAMKFADLIAGSVVWASDNTVRSDIGRTT